MQSTPLTLGEPVTMGENSVGVSPPSQSHLQDLAVHASDAATSYKHIQTQLTYAIHPEKCG